MTCQAEHIYYQGRNVLAFNNIAVQFCEEDQGHKNNLKEAIKGL